MPSQPSAPISQSERSDILDILRGIALLGICLANYPVISLYIFQPPELLMNMPTAGIDKWLAYFHFAFVDGKFYSLFSLLFGIGFSIILTRNEIAGRSALPVFYRRLFILSLIGLSHALLIWEGDILLLYALLGMLLPFFRKCSDRTLLVTWVILILSPLLFDTIKVLTGGKWNLANAITSQALSKDEQFGITQKNFGTWLITHDSYVDVLKWCQSGFFWRWEMLIGTNRLPKVFGMFLLGLFVGRRMIYANLGENIGLLRRVQRLSLFIGLPAALVHAYLELDQKGLPAPIGLLDTAFYALSVVPMSLFYTCSLCLIYLRPGWRSRLMLFAPVGRMALTNYISQTIIGVLLFWGIGFGLGARTGLAWVMLISVIVFAVQIVWSRAWLNYFNYGPLEWIWRQLTYGKKLPLRSKRRGDAKINNF